VKLEKLLSHYSGEVAGRYEANRRGKKWVSEQAVVEELLRLLPKSATVLDIPVGTGRFVSAYHDLGLHAVGMDVSADMIAEARKKPGSESVVFRLGDVRHIEAESSSFDCVVCMRFLNWIDARMLADVVAELVRVSKRDLILGIRYLVPVSEIGFGNLRRILRAVRQLRRYIYRKSELIVHRKSVVTELFNALGLQVVEERCIEKDARGTDYYIYLLRKH
jgi:ubiquinone/menaquinone biosynthesis C-methylase UbiE